MDPKDKKARYRRAQAAFELGNLEQAHQDLIQVKELYPNDVQTLLSKLKDKQDKQDKQEKQQTLATKIHSNNIDKEKADQLKEEGNTLYKQEQYDEATDKYLQVTYICDMYIFNYLLLFT